MLLNKHRSDSLPTLQVEHWQFLVFHDNRRIWQYSEFDTSHINSTVCSVWIFWFRPYSKCSIFWANSLLRERWMAREKNIIVVGRWNKPSLKHCISRFLEMRKYHNSNLFKKVVEGTKEKGCGLHSWTRMLLLRILIPKILFWHKGAIVVVCLQNMGK